MLQPDAVENWVKVKTIVVYCKWIIRIYVSQYIEFIGQNSYKALEQVSQIVITLKDIFRNQIEESFTWIPLNLLISCYTAKQKSWMITSYFPLKWEHIGCLYQQTRYKF